MSARLAFTTGSKKKLSSENSGTSEGSTEPRTLQTGNVESLQKFYGQQSQYANPDASQSQGTGQSPTAKLPNSVEPIASM